MENCKTCTVTLQHRFFTPYGIVEGSFQTIHYREFTVLQDKMELIKNLSECCGAVYNPEENIFEFSSKAGYNAMIEYLTFCNTL